MARPMTDFLDLQGASGAPYRFRHVTLKDLPTMAGNVVVVTPPQAQRAVVFCGAAECLAQAAPRLGAALAAHPGAQLYVRLNVARTTRDAEHADLVAGVRPMAHDQDLG